MDPQTAEVAKSGIDLIEKYADKLSDVLVKYGPDAAQFALEVGRVGALGDVVPWVFGVCIWFTLIGVTIWAARKAKWDILEGNVFTGVAAGGGAMSLFGILPTLMGFPSMYAWVGMFEPSIYLAAKALKL